jgi:cysteinyl-tRNA synthetase
MLTTQSAPSPAACEATSSLQVYNTLSRKKEAFHTVHPRRVGIYLCGPTVYKPSHIGHMVGPVIFDCIKRYLTYCGFEVTLVVNITDVDDKLIDESAQRGIPMSALAAEMTADYHRNLDAMGIDTIDHFPKATDHVDEIVRFTQSLVEKGFAYVAGGDVYFDVGRDREYGKLSNRVQAEQWGDGGGMADRKRSPADFALWKAAKPDEPSWPSPWGPGRPGWHIECSAMSHSLLGETFDIHGGGLDLIFPHHENEIAQSECCHGKAQALYWMHNGLMQAADETGKVGGRTTRAGEAGDQAAQEAGKMGKSKGASPFRDLLREHSPEAIRLFLLSTHYRSPIHFSDDQLRAAAQNVDKFHGFFSRYERVSGQSFYALAAPASRAQAEAQKTSPVVAAHPTTGAVAALRGKFLEAMDDDFNTGGAVAALFDLVRLLNRHIDQERLEQPGAEPEKRAVFTEGTAVFKELANLLGLFRNPPERIVADDGLSGQLIELLIALRAQARSEKNFSLADRIRKSLAELGIMLEDRKDKTEWSRAR